VQDADLVLIGSYVPDGAEIGEWICETATGIKAFYDIDTPVTLSKLHSDEIDYLTTELIPKYDLYLSFTGGPILKTLESKYGAKQAEAFYCSVDPDEYYPESFPMIWDAGYLGTYSLDRQRTLERFFLKAMRMKPDLSMIVAGPQYPGNILWPENVQRIDHIPPDRHRVFYNSQRFAINITRDDMISAGYSPSVRLFEAAACGVPIISDYWAGIESIFVPDQEILIANSAEDVLYFLSMNENESRQIGLNARLKVLEQHTASHRASQLVSYTTRSKESHNYASRNTA
jgi:spore maturation protein CgeB